MIFSLFSLLFRFSEPFDVSSLTFQITFQNPINRMVERFFSFS
nr:MAG TPA: hypothetical protein [Caudoviricetes sp.]